MSTSNGFRATASVLSSDLEPDILLPIVLASPLTASVLSSDLDPDPVIAAVTTGERQSTILLLSKDHCGPTNTTY